MTLEEVNALSVSDFVAAFGAIYEHSPWVAEEAAKARPFADLGAMRAAFSAAVRKGGTERQLALVRAHPELGNRLGIDPDLSAESAREQGGAGLDRLSPEVYEIFRRANDAYRAKFAMPFVICVRQAQGTGAARDVILAQMRRRLASTPRAELAEALTQIDAIAALRLADKMETE